MVIYMGILGICLMIFSALVEFINYCVGKSTRFLDDDDIWKSASYQIEQDLSKVNTSVLLCKYTLVQYLL